MRMPPRRYVGPLDLVRAVPLAAFSCARALSKVTRGEPLISVQRTLDGAVEMFRSDPVAGLIDAPAVDAFIGTRSLTRSAVSVTPFSDLVTVDDPSGIMVGMRVSGAAGIPKYGVHVRSVGGQQVQLTMHLALATATPVTFNDVGGIETIFNQAGTGNHAVQADVVQQPLWTSAIGGMSTMTKFNPQERGGLVATGGPISMADRFTLFAVTAFEDTGYGSLTPLLGINGMQDVFSLYLGANYFGHSALSHEMFDGTNYGEWSSSDLGVVVPEKVDISNILFDRAGKSTSFFNGVEHSYTGDPDSVGQISGRLAIGSNDANLNGTSFKGDVGEVILYGSRLADQDGAQVRKNIADAWLPR